MAKLGYKSALLMPIPALCAAAAISAALTSGLRLRRSAGTPIATEDGAAGMILDLPNIASRLLGGIPKRKLSVLLARSIFNR